MDSKFTISVFTENSPGVLHRITVLFTKRKVNIESLTVSETERKGISRFTIVVDTPEDIAGKIVKQIKRIIEVRECYLSRNADLIFQEISFYKISAESPEKRLEIEGHATRYGASVAFADKNFLVIEKSGREDEVDSLYRLFEPFGILEFVRSGRIAILKHQRTEEPSS